MRRSPHVPQEEIQRAWWALARAYAEALWQSLGERLVAVALFGSVARGEAGPSSDVDLLVIAEGLPARRLERYAWLEEADRAVEPQLRALWGRGITAEVSVILKTPKEAMRITPLYLGPAELLLNTGRDHQGLEEPVQQFEASDPLQHNQACAVRNGRLFHPSISSYSSSGG